MGVSESLNLRAMFNRMLNNNTTRNLWKTFGWPNTITNEDYWRSYKRGGISNRIVKSYPAACWRDGVVIGDSNGTVFDEDDEEFNPFAAAWEQFQKDHKVFHYLERADRMARIGQFGILVMGFGDNKPLSTPMEGQAPLVYLNAYTERSVTISMWDSDPESVRFGLPVLYKVQLQNQSDTGSSQSVPNSSFTVHHTRVVHIVENPDDNEVFGEPALRPVWNYILDLEKVLGSSSETYWLNARGGMSIEAAPDAKLDKDGIANIKEQVEEYENDLRRVLAIQGAKVNMLTSAVTSPEKNVEMLFSVISGTTGIPQRVLFGSERGELASSEDANSWESRVDERRKSQCDPMILAPFVNRMIETGNLPNPVGDWTSEWPEASAASPEKQADVGLKRVNGLVAYANSVADQIVSPAEIRPWFGLDAEPEEDLMAEEDDADTLGVEDEEETDEAAPAEDSTEESSDEV